MGFSDEDRILTKYIHFKGCGEIYLLIKEFPHKVRRLHGLNKLLKKLR